VANRLETPAPIFDVVTPTDAGAVATIDPQVIQKSNTDAESVSRMISLAFHDVPFSFVRIIAIERTRFCIGAHSRLVSFGVAWTCACIGRKERKGIYVGGSLMDKLFLNSH
jgi:hypothetical protein